MGQFISYSSSDTFELGRKIGRAALPNDILFFYGDLGVGKTLFIKGIVYEALESGEIDVTSPTFTYLNIYRAKKTIYHFDLYRLKDAGEFLSMGFDEMFDAEGICCVEWAEKIDSLKIPRATRIQMTHLNNEMRCIDISITPEILIEKRPK